MRNIKKTAFYCSAAISAAIILIGAAMAVSQAREAKSKYIQYEKEMAREDLCAAVDEMLIALRENDEARLNRAAGKAEAYLSRAGFGDRGDVYQDIQRICSGECGGNECAELAQAVKKAVSGDCESLINVPQNKTETEATDDPLTSRMMKRLGKSRDEVALRRAQAFACPGAEFDECLSEIPLSFAYSGENIFVRVTGEASRVTMYCFDRDIDPRYSITPEDAQRNVDLLIKKEKLRLGDERVTEERDGIYRTVCYGKGALSDTPLLTVEIYSDTGRLRLWNAVNYYKNPS